MNSIDQYNEFLTAKIKVAEKHGIKVNPDVMHPSLRPDQKDVAMWCLELGAALCALDAGCGKTRIGTKCALTYLKETEYKNELPTLFDALTKEAV